jgi:Ca-activated chloride channel homolog
VSFSHPAWLAAGLFACLCLLGMWWRYDARQQTALARFISAHLRAELTQSLSIARRRARRGLLLLAVALLFVALAGPLVGYRWEVINRRGNEIVFAVDTSRSMSTPDVKPDRLTRAKLAIDDFTNELDGDAVGLVAFAGGAFLVCPITLDYGAFHESLNAIDTNTIPRGGTNIASAIREAQAALRRRRGADRILILVTDGEDLEGDALVAAEAAAREDGLKIYTIGVGTPQGDLIPVSTNQGSGFVKDDSGAFVKSRLDEPALKAIAAATGGLYAPLGTQGQGFDTIYRTALAPLLKHDVASRRQKVYIQRYQWPLAASLAFLLISQLVGSRRWIRKRRRLGALRPGSAPTARRNSSSAATAGSSTTAGTPVIAASAVAGGAILVLLSVAVTAAAPARASTLSAEEAYKKGDFATAEREYAAAAQHDPAKPALQFNAGTAAYRAGQFPAAAKAFQESISRAPSGDAKRLADQEDAYYNLGNTLYRTGQKTEQSSPQQTMETWTQAVKAYDTALQLRADDADSKFNRDFVKRKIKDLKDKQNQPQNQPNGSQQNPQGQQPPGQQPPGQQPPGQQPPDQQPPGQQPPGKQPPGQQPPGQQPPGQQPPGKQPPGQQPPGQQPPGQQPPGQQPPPGADQPKPGNGQPKAAPGGGDPQDAAANGANQDDTQHAPGQMSREEARELLDSQKSDEHHAQGLPFALRQPDSPPDKPVKDW